MNLLDNDLLDSLRRYPEYVKKYIVRYGEIHRWTPLQINKTFLRIMIDQGIIVPFSIGRDPIISRTQQMLYDDYHSGKITVKSANGSNVDDSGPLQIYDPVVPVDSDSLRDELEECENYIDLCADVFEQLIKGKNLSYIWTSNKLKRTINEIGGSNLISSDGDDVNAKERWKNVVKEVDKAITKRIDNCETLDYIHPAIRENIRSINNIDNLDELCDRFEALKGETRHNDTTGGEKYVLDTIKRELLPKKNGDGFKFEKVKLTETYNSLLKKGRINYVINFKYLEFIRDEKDDNLRPIVVSKNNDKFIVALGKDHKDKVPPSWAELYFFNVNGMNGETIEFVAHNLEQFMVLLIAKKIEILEIWKDSIINGTKPDRIKKELLIEKHEEIMEDLGTYGGEVYVATLSIADNTVNFPMPVSSIENYIKRVIVKLNKAICNPEVRLAIMNDGKIQYVIDDIKNEKDIIKKLKLLAEGLHEVYSNCMGVGSDMARPIYLLDAINNGKINCEVFASLALCLITSNKQVFSEIDHSKICFGPLDFMQKFGIRQPHMFLIFEYNGNKQIFDPTTLTHLYEDKIVSEIIDRDFYENYKIPKIVGGTDE